MYPHDFSSDVVNKYLEAHPRGWAELSRTFYIREENVISMFQKDQFLWNKFKHLLKKVDSVALRHPEKHINLGEWCKNDRLIPWLLRRIYELELFSDDMDFLLYPHD